MHRWLIDFVFVSSMRLICGVPKILSNSSHLESIFKKILVRIQGQGSETTNYRLTELTSCNIDFSEIISS